MVSNATKARLSLPSALKPTNAIEPGPSDISLLHTERRSAIARTHVVAHQSDDGTVQCAAGPQNWGLIHSCNAHMTEANNDEGSKANLCTRHPTTLTSKSHTSW